MGSSQLSIGKLPTGLNITLTLPYGSARVKMSLALRDKTFKIERRNYITVILLITAASGVG